MGKCISKDQQLKIREIDERSYIAITDEFEYFHYETSYVSEEDFIDEYEGQSESKKSSTSKKMHGPETKGTSMSFGFKKKSYSATSKKQLNITNNNNIDVNRETDEKATIISNLNVIKAEQNNFVITGDDNGNSTNTEHLQDKEIGTTRTTSPAKLQPAKRDQLLVGRSNRFGFRQNVIRPTSGITPKFNEYDNVNNNSTVDKQRRSKSATVTTNQIRSNVNPQSSYKLEINPLKSIAEQSEHKITKQNEQNANINACRPTSSTIQATTAQASNANQPIILSRYTLHSTSLPRPQYPVSVSVTPSYPNYSRSSTYSPSSNRHIHSVQSKLIDTKGAKHQANITKRGGLMTRRDESFDSGIASHESTSDNYQDQMETSIVRRSRRRFEMIPGPSRHKFEIRDLNLNDYNENSVVIPLSLPKLPTDRNEIVTNGLIRSTNSYTTDNEMDMSISESGSRPTSFISTASEAESFEEEKLKMDNNLSEKSLKGAIMKEKTNLFNSKNSSPSSSKSKSSWACNSNGGESMALKDCSSVSLSSSDEDRRNKNTQPSYLRKKDIDCDEDELSSMTITADQSSCLNSKSSPSKDQKEIVNDAFMKQSQQQPRIGCISRKELFIQVDEAKFAETVAAAKNTTLLDDETSPSDSLVSSSESGDVPIKKVKEAETKENYIISDIKEEDLEDITPELVDLASPGTPTHASNSLSLSDVGRDFLIDDEIADQPALMISHNKKQNGSPSHRDDFSNAAFNLTSTDGTATTPTLKDLPVDSHGSLKSLNKIQALKVLKSDQSSPAMNRKMMIMERSGSLDTLSPCDSIASDDLMGDFDIASSIDSIDRHEQSIDDLCVHSETECKINGDFKKEHGAIFRPQPNIQRRHSSRENITSQLPLRATRLLNRRLQNNNNSPPILNGTENMHKTSARVSLREHLKQKQQLNIQSQLEHSSTEDLLVDKSLRNSMLQDVASFKKELVHLRRILQESDTLNPFEMNGHIFSSLNRANGMSSACEAEIACNNNNNDREKKDDEKNVVLTSEQIILLEDQRQELADLKRQVVFLQSQIDDKDRLIKQQQTKLEEFEKEKSKSVNSNAQATNDLKTNVETSNSATQTERLRPMSMGQDFTSQLDSPLRSPTNDDKSTTKQHQQQQIPTITIKPSPIRSKTQISSVYTKLSSIKPTTSTNSLNNPRSSTSIPTTFAAKLPMKSTKIEHPKISPLRIPNTVLRVNDNKAPIKRTIPQLIKINGTTAIGSNKNSASQKILQKSSRGHLDDSNGNSATSSLSTSSSNSSLNGQTKGSDVEFLANQLNKIYSRGLIE